MLTLLLACRDTQDSRAIPYPAMTLSETTIDFGDVAWAEIAERTLVVSNEGGMPMGIGALRVGANSPGFGVSYDPCAIECGEVASAKDTAGDSGGWVEECGGPLVLEPGCRIAATVTYSASTPGEARGAVWVESVSAASEALVPPSLADPIHTTQVTYLSGATEHGGGVPSVRPLSADFGFVHPGVEAPPRTFTLTNIGDADLVVTDAALPSDCGSDFSFVVPLAPGVLAPAASTSFEVAFTPSSTATARCDLRIRTGRDETWIALAGNLATAPNAAPIVSIVAPIVGTVYVTTAALPMEIALSDPDGPGTALTCRVRSAVLPSDLVEDCTPVDESGVVRIALPADRFVAGADTLEVTVSDGRSGVARATVAVLVDVPPEGADADGFGDADCDDADPAVYPGAAEVYDGADNDCDGTIDEGTVASDDDGDGQTELNGDCDDAATDTFLGARERQDGLDNDCDGAVDDGTDAADDDGDGYTEVQRDCDDTDPAVNPEAVEVCDDVDDDCDGLRACDEPRVGPRVVGGVIRTEQSAMLAGETRWLDAEAIGPDGETLLWAWRTDGPGTFEDATSQRARYTAPPVAAAREELLYVQVSDADGDTDVAGVRIVVYPAETPLYDAYTDWSAPERECGCGGDRHPGSALALAMVAVLAFLRARPTGAGSSPPPAGTARDPARR